MPAILSARSGFIQKCCELPFQRMAAAGLYGMRLFLATGSLLQHFQILKKWYVRAIGVTVRGDSIS